jgi:FMN hydrolase / 5-amino-6-(5-phospho-D-ribitylamino)uracil phosphatase
MRPLITVLSFDLDDTLWETAPVLRVAERALVDHLMKVSAEWAQAYLSPGWSEHRDEFIKAHPTMAHDVSWLRQQVLSKTAAAAGVDVGLAQEAFEVFLSARQKVCLYPEVEAALNALARDYRMVALTNGNACIHRTGVGHWFVDSINPMTAQVAKPDPEFFKVMLRRLNASPEEVVHIGDDPYTDVLGAQNVGIEPVWVNRHNQSWPASAQVAAPRYSLSDLSQLQSILHQIQTARS